MRVQQPRSGRAQMHCLEDAVPEKLRRRDENPGGGGGNAVRHRRSVTGVPNYARKVSATSLAAMLRERGLRLTPQRQLILEAVHELGHATPEQVHTAVRERVAGVNITTVYRTLELLEELGLVNHTHLSHGSPTYHAAGEDQHVHLVCRGCGSISEVDPTVMQPVTDRLLAEQGFRVDVGHVSLFGVCGQCKEL